MDRIIFIARRQVGYSKVMTEMGSEDKMSNDVFFNMGSLVGYLELWGLKK